MSFAAHLRRLAKPIWAAELEHPFVTGLGDGSLPVERFRFYLAQDYLFLLAYCQVFALAVARAPDEATMSHFTRLLDATLHTEMDLHRDYAAMLYKVILRHTYRASRLGFQHGQGGGMSSRTSLFSRTSRMRGVILFARDPKQGTTGRREIADDSPFPTLLACGTMAALPG